MVGPVHLGMTVRTRTIKNKPGRRGKGFARMADVDVTLLAEPRLFDREHILVDRAVRFMTAQTVLQRRRVLPEKRAALIRVTLIAVFVDRVLDQHRRGGCPVRIVTISAGHFSFPQRHV